MTNTQIIKWFLEILNECETAQKQREFSRLCVNG